MSIEISEFTNVSISVSPTGVSAGNFGILGFLALSSDLAKVPVSHAERSRGYTSLKSVSADWEATSEVYKSATAFYGQTPTPKDFRVLMSYVTAQPAVLFGGSPAPVSTIAAISGTGEVVMTVGTQLYDMSTLSFTSDSTYAEIATKLATTMNAISADSVTVEYVGGQFVIKSVVLGTAATITSATGDAALALGLQAHQAQIANGIGAETPVAALAANLDKGVEWVATDLDKSLRDNLAGSGTETTLAIAQWHEAAKRIFMNTTNDTNVLKANVTTDVAHALQAATLRYSLTTFSNNAAQYPSSSVFGRAASTNFGAVGTTITLNLKQMPGVTVEELTPNQYAALKGKYASAVVRIGKSTNAYADSRMASGSWLDTTHGLMWLENRCEVDLFNLLYTTNTKIPFTETGINMVSLALSSSLKAAVRNGLAAPGYLADGTFLPEGYRIDTVPLEDVPSSDLGNRHYYGMSFVMKGAGALHGVDIAGSFTE